jgi:hypothetical protein
MTSKALFHYLLTFTVLFASSFAVFHGSEHIAIDKVNASKASFTVASSGFHSESEDHHVEETDSPRTNHSIESLCEACLVLSNLTAHGLAYSYLAFSSEKTKHRLFNLVHSKRQAFQTYHSRAPPRNA